MPHINSMRLVNVHFNNATQFYDDFIMQLNGKNTTFDLENGGGKSLLLLMLLQTVLPKSYLRREKPLSLIFQGGKDRTSHVAVEWLLEEGSGYKYLLTGFSARKRKGPAGPAGAAESDEEEMLGAADVEHLNWCIFHNNSRNAGIRSLPLCTGAAGNKRVAGFEDIRRYLQQMRQKGLPVEVFDKIEQYQSYIAAHHLLPAEWKIIKGINSGENNIESYFRQNGTSRKLIENQFVKIVEDVEALSKGGGHKDDSLLLADTLIEIRNRLNEYLRLQGHMAEYEKIKDYYAAFGRKNEAFLQAYQAYEACRGQAAAIYNLIASNLKELERQKAATGEKFARATAGASEGRQRKRLLAAGLCRHEKEKLVARRQQLEAAREHVDQRQKELQLHFNHLLALEGYGEYRKVKLKAAELNQRLQAMQLDGDALAADYREAGGRLRFLTGKQLAALAAAQEQAAGAKRRLQSESDQAGQELLAAAKKAAVLEKRLEDLAGRETQLQEQLQEINAFFLQSGEIDGILTPEQFLRRLEDELKQYLDENESVSEKIKTLDHALQQNALAVVAAQGRIDQQQAVKKPLEDWLTGYRREQSGMAEKAAGFEAGTLEAYQEKLQLLAHRETLHKLKKEIEAGRRRQKKQLSEERGYYVPNEEILSLAGQLHTKCAYVQAGIDWIARADLEERQTILREMPYLPFAVIVDRSSFERLKNGRLKIDFASDYPVPVVNLETVRRADSGAGIDVHYFCGFAGLLLDSGRYAQYILGLTHEIEALDGAVQAADARIAELTGAIAEVNAFYGKYPQNEIENKQASVTALEKELSALNDRLHTLKEQGERFRAEKELCGRRLEELAGLMAGCREKIEKLAAAGQTANELAQTEAQLRAGRQELVVFHEKIAEIKHTITRLKQESGAVEAQLSLLQFERYNVQKEMQALSGFAGIENDLPIDTARAGFAALQQALSGKIAAESELRSSLEEQENRLGAIKERILRDCGEDLEAIEIRGKNGRIIMIPTPDMIREARTNSEENLIQLNKLTQEVNEAEAAVQRKTGELEAILKAAGVAADTALPRFATEDRYRQEIDRAEQLIKSYEEEIRRSGEELERLKEAYFRLNNQKESFGAFMEREKVDNDGIMAPETKEYRQFENEFLGLRIVLDKQGEQWEDRLKSIQAETASFIIREPLEELAKVARPVSAAQCRARIEAFAAYIANIDEQMQKISSDIRQLESYQEDFTRRCLQRAELVLGHLRKLEALSRIEVYGRRTSMIELKLPEFEEKDKLMRVKAHIDAIVREIGGEGTVDRKRVAARLATKELLAQIVDMDKAAVRLYKIESIPENSRFYRWENAIGSEGQNNSLYFIFAACLISFIRMLSITNIAVKTKKVIIADNPFGATSAVYLWDPMFKILKQNDIQLIAPGHRIPREITSKFGVNYLLNQDILQDGRMRVVVKDVRAEEDEDVLSYIEPEQLSLF